MIIFKSVITSFLLLPGSPQQVLKATLTYYKSISKNFLI